MLCFFSAFSCYTNSTQCTNNEISHFTIKLFWVAFCTFILFAAQFCRALSFQLARIFSDDALNGYWERDVGWMVDRPINAFGSFWLPKQECPQLGWRDSWFCWFVSTYLFSLLFLVCHGLSSRFSWKNLYFHFQCFHSNTYTDYGKHSF